jgi:hypothetical protein
MGLFGRDRKKDLWDAINSSQEGYAPGYTPQDQGAYDTTPDAPPERKGMSPLAAAALGFIGGPGMTEVLHARQAKGEQEDALRQLGYQDADIKALRNSPTALAQVLADRYGAHPAPPNDTERDYHFILQTRGKEAADAFLDNKANPTRYIEVDDGQGGKRIVPVGGSQGAQSAGGPQPGMVKNGYRFKGGNPNDPNAWEEIGGAGQAQAPSTFRTSGLFGRR